jgi:ABC-type multidrug transport system fused ATPase/permease subunit
VSERPSYRQTFFRLLGFLKPYKWSLIVSILLSIGSQAAAVVIAFLTGDGLQEATTSGSREAIWWIAIGILIAGLVRAADDGRRLISGRQAPAVEFDMRNGLYAKLQRLVWVLTGTRRAS